MKGSVVVPSIIYSDKQLSLEIRNVEVHYLVRMSLHGA